MDNKTIFTVKISDNYCEWEYAIQVDNKRCIKDFVKCIEGGLSAKVVNEKLINNYDESNQINMENFKLDLTQLTPVAEKDRVRGNWYVVADLIREEYPRLEQYHESNKDFSDCPWKHWFAIPPNLPGFQTAELPDEFELKAGEWLDASGFTVPYSQKFKRKPPLPELTIPSGTLEEQIDATKKILAELETKAGGSR